MPLNEGEEHPQQAVTIKGKRLSRRNSMKLIIVNANDEEAAHLSSNLLKKGYDIYTVKSGKEALDMYEHADMVMLDLNLPDIDGIAVCRSLRADSDIPIIAFTDHGAGVDIVQSLQAGADYCLVRPYRFRELAARIEALARHWYTHRREAKVITHGPLHVDAQRREVLVGGRTINLTRKEFDLLYLLALQPGTVLSRDQVMSRVWGYVWDSSSSRTLDMHVSSLRRKLGSRNWIVRVPRVGICLGRPQSG
jgi:DNA-binding response OmpR family regulator